MCIIMSKPVNVAFPEESILKNCWDNNPDMGGFMYALNNKVYIRKGFKTWESFYEALNRSRKQTGDNIPYVCHFRISTQGYDTSCCQPFPLSGKMSNLKKRKTECNIGVAHNGVLSLTSDGALDYSDTMKFITDFLTNIIRSYNWFEDSRTHKLIENLIEGSRFAILDKNGHCETMGDGWVEEKGCFFSNHTYSYKKQTAWWQGSSINSYYDYYEDFDWDAYFKAKDKALEKKSDKAKKNKPKSAFYPWSHYWNYDTAEYDFVETYCPYTEEDDDSYCEGCSQMGKCSYTKNCGLCAKKA